MSKVKTNAMRILDTLNIEYDVLLYDKRDGRIDGLSVAEKIGRGQDSVFKTLVVQANSGGLYVFIIPVGEELDLKAAARATGEKKVEMIAVKDITKHTGYIRGGCSPIGMKKDYPTFIDESALNLKTMVVSGGKLGVQIELTPESLKSIVKGEIYKLTK